MSYRITQKNIILKLLDPVTRPSREEVDGMVSQDIHAFFFGDGITNRDRGKFIDFLCQLPEHISIPTKYNKFHAMGSTINFNVDISSPETRALQGLCVVKFDDDNKITNFYLNEIEEKPVGPFMQLASVIMLSAAVFILFTMWVEKKIQ